MSYTLEFDESKGGAQRWQIKWHSEFVMGLAHPWTASMMLKELKELGDPDSFMTKSGPSFRDEVQRRFNRLARVVPCSPTTSKSQSGCGAGVGEPCKRPSEHVTHLDQPHSCRVERFDVWLAELAEEMGVNNGYLSADEMRKDWVG